MSKMASATAPPRSATGAMRELIVLFAEETSSLGPPSATAVAHKLTTALKLAGATLAPLFASAETISPPGAAMLSTRAARRSRFHRVIAADDHLDELAARLRKEPSVEAAYIKPAPQMPNLSMPINQMTAASAPAPSQTSDFEQKQGYLDRAPGGIDARYAWTLAGGRGKGITICDVEGGYTIAHEDLRVKHEGLKHGRLQPDWIEHGTAVLGVLKGDLNGYGVTGIAAHAKAMMASIYPDEPNSNPSTSGAIDAAWQLLKPGDILVVEVHRAGPRHKGEARDDQLGYVAIEWWDDDFEAIRAATEAGIIVVAAAGNGAEDLDDDLYDKPLKNFPKDWANPFRRQTRDSGAILVGAGAPPVGGHGTDRSRLSFSNYGECVDTQGWGREVTTTGYGDLQGGPKASRWYTSQFAGTSSATPIVAGAIACVQGILKAAGRPLLTPQLARNLLRGTGSPQSGPAELIGTRPDLRKMIRKVAPDLVAQASR